MLFKTYWHVLISHDILFVCVCVVLFMCLEWDMDWEGKAMLHCSSPSWRQTALWHGLPWPQENLSNFELKLLQFPFTIFNLSLSRLFHQHPSRHFTFFLMSSVSPHDISWELRHFANGSSFPHSTRFSDGASQKNLKRKLSCWNCRRPMLVMSCPISLSISVVGLCLFVANDANVSSWSLGCLWQSLAADHHQILWQAVANEPRFKMN